MTDVLPGPPPRRAETPAVEATPPPPPPTSNGSPDPGAPTGPSDRASVVARGGFANGIGSLVGVVLNMGLVVLVTRGYGARGAGVFFGAMALFMVIGNTAKLGGETGLVYAISRRRSTRRHGEIPALILVGLLPALLAGAASAVLLFVFAPQLAGLFTESGTEDAFARVVWVQAAFVPLWVVVYTLQGATRGFGRMKPTVTENHIIRPALQVVLMAVVVVAGGGLVALGLAWVLPLLVTTALAARSVRVLLDGLPDDAVATTPMRPLAREFWAFAGPRGAAASLQITLERTGVLLVGGLASAAAAGLYVAVTRVIGAFNLFFHSVGQALNPQISALLAHDEHDEAERLLRQLTAWTMLLVTPALVVVSLFSDAVLGVFGATFSGATPALLVLALTTLLSAPLAYLDNVLLMGGRSTLSLIDTAVALALTITGYVVLIPELGVTGAAIGWAAGLLGGRLLELWQVWRSFRIHPLGAAVLTATAVPILVVGGVGLAGRALLGATLPAACVVGFVGLGVYAVVLRAQRDRWELGELRRLVAR